MNHNEFNDNERLKPLVILAGAPEHHDDTEEAGEEKMPEGLVQPQVLPLRQAVYHLGHKICTFV